jgi:hypothetical protein
MMRRSNGLRSSTARAKRPKQGMTRSIPFDLDRSDMGPPWFKQAMGIKRAKGLARCCPIAPGPNRSD